MKDIMCLRCNTHMSHIKQDYIQLGKAVFGSSGISTNSQALAGALLVDIYVCGECGKLEFFRAGSGRKNDAEVKKPVFRDEEH